MQSKFLPFHLPEIGNEEIQSVIETLQSGWLTTGPKVELFEQEFAKIVGCKYAIAVNSGTAALHLALEGIHAQAGDEIILPTMTFAATAEVVLYFKARPVLVDCQMGSFNIDPYLIEKAITPKTKAIIPVHFGGQPCEMDRILEIAKHYKLRVIEDAAHAFPARYKEAMVGTIGDITCFSFYVTKTITTGEGGMITTENVEYANRMRTMSLHGISKDIWKRYSSEGSWYYEILYPGYKYNLTDIAAAIGIEQLKKSDRFYEARRQIAIRYNEEFADLSEITTPVISDDVQHSWHLYVIQLNLNRLRITRNEFIENLKEENIGTSVHFIPLHLHPYYRQTFGYQLDDFPNAKTLFERIISLPIYPKMNEADVDHVAQAVRKIIELYRR